MPTHLLGTRSHYVAPGRSRAAIPSLSHNSKGCRSQARATMPGLDSYFCGLNVVLQLLSFLFEELFLDNGSANYDLIEEIWPTVLADSFIGTCPAHSFIHIVFGCLVL